MAAAMDAYWHEHPPVHLLVAAYLDFKPSPAATTAAGDPIEMAAEFLPVNRHSAADFNALLAQHGLPTDG